MITIYLKCYNYQTFKYEPILKLICHQSHLVGHILLNFEVELEKLPYKYKNDYTPYVITIDTKRYIHWNDKNAGKHRDIYLLSDPIQKYTVNHTVTIHLETRTLHIIRYVMYDMLSFYQPQHDLNQQNYNYIKHKIQNHLIISKPTKKDPRYRQLYKSRQLRYIQFHKQLWGNQYLIIKYRFNNLLIQDITNIISQLFLSLYNF